MKVTYGDFFKMSFKLTFYFDVCFQNIDVINYYWLEKVNELHYWYWYDKCYSVNKNNTKASDDFAE